jgi:dolichyl-phosphate beta-glucosyltransferase
MRKMTLTVVVPVYNEAERVHRALEALAAYEPPEPVRIKKVVFVDDGSSDQTVELLQNADHCYPCEIVTYPENRGRGYAVRRGLDKVNTDYALYLDADMSIPLENLEAVVPHMREGADVIAGSKKMPETVCTQKRSLLRKLVGWGHSAVSSLALGVWMHDFQGGFKLLSRRAVQEVLPRTSLERWGLDLELIFVADQMGLSIAEFPVTWGHVENGTKVNVLRDSFRALTDLAVIRWNGLSGKYVDEAEPDAMVDLETVYEMDVS